MMKEYDYLVVCLKREGAERKVAAVFGYPTRKAANDDRPRLMELYGQDNVDEVKKAI